jgi:thiol-disulfide isomerase/thioredoxin
MKINEKIKQGLSGWAMPLLVIGILYATGLHTEVIGAVQKVFLATGISQPDTSLPTSEGTETDRSRLLPYTFTLTDINGAKVEASHFKNKVLFINHWATWCPPCVAEMPNIQRLYNKVDTNKVEFIMISFDKDPEKARKFMKRKGHTFPIYFMAGPLPAELDSDVIPTTFVIAPDGRIVTKKEGMADYDTKVFLNFLHKLAGLQ